MPDIQPPPESLQPDPAAVGEPAQREAFLRTFLARRPQMEALLRRRVGCRATAADLVQELFLRFWRRPALPLEDMGSYLIRSAHNLAIDHMRSEGARSRGESALLPEQRAGTVATPDAALEAGSDLRRIDAALRALPERTRHIFLLNRIHGRTYAEIARSMSLSQSAVEKHMMRALDACKASVVTAPPARTPLGSAPS
ncbi:RNA polymerase sigma factor [Phytopseudomonas dryadis]|uniref:RNA polymerase subunit sigma-24 n=1 Tax=Phytopseudomonas dryadis TaxID=2487520 RepID=A0A4Q9QSX1_9GAMM|nr:MULTISPECIES: RNA polymerase sigma factor [Pseudomonas]TBU85177.1 RNA polymerase subunit sigma-24 [Pseudomonas dryadis]TBU98776.1 RNA polymerase subunit sigma-24 [Pseudomonas dryadis]TBV13403.1 RNA polymerase subunit sigma-24 [Pseudomonas sp. FRB 230]